MLTFVNEKKSAVFRLAILLILLLAAFLRLKDLGEESLWVDEIGHFRVSSRENLLSILTGVRSHEGAAPLDYLVLHSYLNLIENEDEFSIRLPYALFGILSVWLFFLLAVDLFGKTSSLFSTFVFSISYFHITYSQEVRFYSLAVFLSILSTYLALQYNKNGNLKVFYFWVIVSILGIQNYYFHGIVATVQYLFIWTSAVPGTCKSQSIYTDSGRQVIDPLIVGAILIAIFSIPWLIWDSQSGFNLPGYKATISLSSALDQFAYVVGGMELLNFMGLCASLLLLGKKEGKFILAMFPAAFLVIWVLGRFFDYPFVPRQLVFVYPYLVLAMFGGVSAVQQSVAKSKCYKNTGKHVTELILAILISIPVVIGSFNSLRTYYGVNQKPNWQEVAEYLQSDRSSNIERILVFTPGEQTELEYYLAINPSALHQEVSFVPNEAVLENQPLTNSVVIVISEFWSWALPEWISSNPKTRMQNLALIGNVNLFLFSNETD